MEFNPEAIQVLVGGGAEHTLPIAVLEYSIRSRSRRLIQVTPLLTVEREIAIPVPREPKQRAVTSFSFQRFLIPQALGFTGKGIYLDSDMIVRTDIGDLWDTPFPPDTEVNMCPGWQSAVMLIDAKCGWCIDKFIGMLDENRIRYKDLVNVKQVARCGNTLDPLWNCIDRPDPMAMNVKHAKLLHYTDMNLQPWLTAKHPHGGEWRKELKAAIDAGFIDKEDVLREIEDGHVRPSLAVVVDEEPPYDDKNFVYPDAKRKQAENQMVTPHPSYTYSEQAAVDKLKRQDHKRQR